MSQRKVIDCSTMPSEMNCTLKISGSEEEVLPIAIYHAIKDHGHKDSPELREGIRAGLVNE